MLRARCFMAGGNEKIRELIKNRMQDISSSGLVTSCRVWLKVKDLMDGNVATVAEEQTVALAATMMADEGISSLVVMDNSTVTGIITEKDFLEKVVAKGKNAVEVRVREVMSSPVVSVPPGMSVLEASRVAEEKRVKRLPVIDGGNLVGIITQTDLIRVLMSYGMWHDVAEIMTKEAATIQCSADVAEAAAIMASRGISGIIVMRADKVAGVLTERDILKRVIARGQNPASVKLEEVMSSPVVSIPPYYSIFSASRIMEKKHVRRLVVEDNNWLCGIVTQTDIFRTVEEKWRQEEEKNLKSLEESDTCVYTLDLDCRTTFVNPAFMRLLEVADKSQLLGKPFLPEQFWFNPQQRTQFVSQLKKGAVHISDLTLKTAGGRRIDITVYSSLTKNIHGQFDGIQGAVNDITARKELVTLKDAQQQLAASEQRYRHITEAVTDYIYTVRFESGRPVETIHRPTSVAVTGYTPEELKANPKLWLDIVHPDDLEVVREQVSRCICGQKFRTIEHRIIRKDGSIRWVRRTLVPQFDSQGKLLSYDGLLQDITELKIAEQVQIQMFEELEQATEELKDFAYVASHNLKAPLRNISSLAGWISDDCGEKLGEQGREHIKLLLSRVKRMYNMIEGVLQYSQAARREKGDKVDLNELLAGAIEDVDVPNNIEVIVKKNLPVVVCCPDGVRQVFYNLISNAVNFMDKPRGRIEIDWTQEHGYWRFSVADNGPGIEEKHFDRIFKMFQTLPSGDNRETTGVGLTITKKIIELFGGRVWVKSTPGRGSTFFFTVPKEHKRTRPLKMLAAADVN